MPKNIRSSIRRSFPRVRPAGPSIGVVPSPTSGLQRVNYFTGQMLGVDDLTAEQDYVRARFRRLNLAQFGVGIVSGLAVSVSKDGNSINVAPGLAIGPSGDEIAVTSPQSAALMPLDKALLVQIRYAEKLCNPVPARAEVGDVEVQYSRVLETFELIVSSDVVADAIVIAELRRSRLRWSIARRAKAKRR
jgi:hypothetical protein